MDVSTIVTRLGGIASTRQLADAGCSARLLVAACGTGAITRVRRGWYATRAPKDVIAAVRAGGNLGCCSALRLAGAWVLDDDLLHVTVDAHAHPRTARPGIKLHWVGGGLRDGYPMVGVVEALEQFLVCGSEAAMIAAVDSVLNRGLARESEVIAMLTASARGRRVAAAIDPESQSGLESLVRVALRRRQVRVRTQVFIPGAGRVDLLVGDRLVVELDGEEWHSGERFEEDRRRDLALVAAGYLVVRVSYKQVLGDWPAIERSLLAIIRRRDHLWRGQFRRSGQSSDSS